MASSSPNSARRVRQNRMIIDYSILDSDGFDTDSVFTSHLDILRVIN